LVSLAPRAVQAGNYDLDLTGLGSQQGGNLVQDDSAFRSLSSELGTVMAPRPVDPADSLGLSGFAISADFGVNTIRGDSDYWERSSRGRAGNVAPTMQIMARKGLWPGLEVGAGATHLFDSRMWAMSGYGKIAIRGSFSRLLGAKDFNMTTAAPSISLSYVFGLGKTFSLTPYAGYEALIIIARSHVLDATPNCDEFADAYNEECPGVDTDANNEFVFKNAGAIVRHRPYFGARFIFSVMRLGFEVMLTPAGKRAGEIEGNSVADRSGFQQQYTFSVGLDF
jgi:hypothetical protein